MVLRAVTLFCLLTIGLAALPVVKQTGSLTYRFSQTVQDDGTTQPPENPIVTPEVGFDRVAAGRFINNRILLIQFYDENYFKALVVSENLASLNAVESVWASNPVQTQWYKVERGYAKASRKTHDLHRGTFRDYYDNTTYYQVLVNGVAVSINRHTLAPSMSDNTNLTRVGVSTNVSVYDSDLVFNAYLQIPPVTDNANITINCVDGVVITMNFKSTVCQSIKVNQMGYTPTCNKKAYFGWGIPYYPWEPVTFNIVPSVSTFDLINEDTGLVEYRGTIDYPISCDAYNTINARYNSVAVGEWVYGMDFSAVTKNGTYHLWSPAVGRSWSFQITPDVYSAAVYHVARAVYTQRCQPIPSANFYYWYDDANHKTLYQGYTPIYNPSLADQVSGYGLFIVTAGVWTYSAEDSRVVLGKQKSALITLNKVITTNYSGGWHDAADCDKRPYHLASVYHLCMAYLFNPALYSDGQFDYPAPENNNGIPDILDEAINGMDVWRRLQLALWGTYQGGVMMKVDTTTDQPLSNDDTHRWYYGIPDALSTAECGLGFSMIAYTMNGVSMNHPVRLDYIQAAEDCWSYIETGLTHDWTATRDDGSMYVYKEPPWQSTFTLSKENTYTKILTLALNLYLLTEKAKYYDFIAANMTTWNAYLSSFSDEWNKNNYDFLLMWDKTMFPTLSLSYYNRLKYLESARFKAWPYPKITLGITGKYRDYYGNAGMYKAAMVYYGLWAYDHDQKWVNKIQQEVDCYLGMNNRGESRIAGVAPTGPSKYLGPYFAVLRQESRPGHICYGPNANSGMAYAQDKWGAWVDYSKDSATYGGTTVGSMMASAIATANASQFTYWWPDTRRYSQGNKGLAVGITEFTVWESLTPMLTMLSFVTPGVGYTRRPEIANWRPSSNFIKEKPFRTMLVL